MSCDGDTIVGLAAIVLAPGRIAIGIAPVILHDGHETINPFNTLINMEIARVRISSGKQNPAARPPTARKTPNRHSPAGAKRLVGNAVELFRVE
jgi:hypothetical protein